MPPLNTRTADIYAKPSYQAATPQPPNPHAAALAYAPPVQRATPHTRAADWGELQWRQQVKHVEPSPGGSVGVLFVWTVTHADYKAVPPEFVIKPVAGGASTTFAEQVLAQVAGAASPDSRVVPAKASGGQGVLYWVRKLATAGTLAADRVSAYQSADSFLLQKAMGGYTEMSDAYQARPKALTNLLKQKDLMRNLGRLAAADLILGNGDRVQGNNFGNIMFDRKGQMAAIDSAALLGSFAQSLKSMAATGDLCPMQFCHTTAPEQLGEWVRWGAEGGKATPSDDQIGTIQARMLGVKVPMPVLPSMATLDPVERARHGLLFDRMRQELEGRIDLAEGTPTPIDPPSEAVWKEARANFVRGFEAGLAAIDTLLGGLAHFKRKALASPAWVKLKEEYKKVGYSGVDPNLSWLNLVVRREMYMQLRQGKSMDEAVAAGQAVAARKHGKMLAQGRTG